MMKHIKLIGLLFGISVSVAIAQKSEMHILVRVTNFDGSSTIEDVTQAQLATLRKNIMLENNLIKDAYANVSKEWRKSNETNTIGQVITYKNVKRTVQVRAPNRPFPLKRPAPREISQLGSFPTPEAAAEKKSALESAVKPVVTKKSEGAEDKTKAEPSKKETSRKESSRNDNADTEQLFQSLMDELKRLKEEPATPQKAGGGKKKSAGR
ncbi:MAG: hypothetical protein PHR77_21750 [Kiritimatiellae bacterium]|nr:hypothetical protein [Kiritimatiellia bacterium]MDD5521839.1 hypothetical protein [Kiritimatiellia bacterium]